MPGHAGMPFRFAPVALRHGAIATRRGEMVTRLGRISIRSPYGRISQNLNIVSLSVRDANITGLELRKRWEGSSQEDPSSRRVAPLRGYKTALALLFMQL